MASISWLIAKAEVEMIEVALLRVCECVFRCLEAGGKMTEQEADFHSGSGQHETALKQESGEEEKREHAPAPLNAKLLQ